MSIIVRDGRRAVRVTGEDRRAFLDATLSQAVADLPGGRRRSALWLDVHGAPLAAFDVAAPPADDVLLLVVAGGQLGAVTDGLAMRTFLQDAAFEVLDDDVVAVRLGAEESWEGLEPGTVSTAGEVLVLHVRGGVDLVGPTEDVAALLRERGLGAVDSDVSALLDWEVRTGVPRIGHEIEAPHLPEEVGVLPTHVHLAKGCYPGQEAVARMWMLGRPRRRLAILDVVEGDALPAVGDEVGAGRDRVTVTRVTSTAPMAALAFVPPSTEVGASIEAHAWRATVRGYAGDGLEQPGADPRVTRRRDR